MKTIEQELSEQLKQILFQIFPGIHFPENVYEVHKSKHADYQWNGALIIDKFIQKTLVK